RCRLRTQAPWGERSRLERARRTAPAWGPGRDAALSAQVHSLGAGPATHRRPHRRPERRSERISFSAAETWARSVFSLLDQPEYVRFADACVNVCPFHLYISRLCLRKSGDVLLDERNGVLHGNGEAISLDEPFRERFGRDDPHHASRIVAQRAAAVA